MICSSIGTVCLGKNRKGEVKFFHPRSAPRVYLAEGSFWNIQLARYLPGRLCLSHLFDPDSADVSQACRGRHDADDIPVLITEKQEAAGSDHWFHCVHVKLHLIAKCTLYVRVGIEYASVWVICMGILTVNQCR